MKRWMTLLFCAALLVLLIPAALAEGGDGEEPETVEAVESTEAAEPEAEKTEEAEDTVRAASGTVSFDALGDAMRGSYYPLLALEENLAALKASGGDAAAQRQLEDAENQMLRGGETLYITLAGLEAQDAALTRTIASLDRRVQEMELRCALGQISELQLTQVKNARAQTVSGQQTLRMNMEAARMQLKAMTGVALDGTLALSPLPKVTDAQLAAMDLTADLARAKDASYALESARKTRDESVEQAEAGAAYGVPGAQNAADAARYTYESTALNFELSLRTLYAQVKDDAQALAAKRAALAAEEQNYAASALQFEQGRISANALADAADTLAEAKDAVAAAERTLFSDYRSYHWAVEYGMLGSEGGMAS